MKKIASLVFIICFLSIGIHATKAQTNVVSDDIELAVLKNIYDSLGGAGWTSKTNWPSTWPATATSAQFGTWKGISVTQGDITAITLTSNNLTGQIPASISKLVRLKNIYLSSNSIGGSIPGSLAELPSLNNVFFDHNLLSGNIPAQLGDMPKVLQLRLQNNSLTGSIPSALGNATTLTQLNVSYNLLSGTIPASLNNLTAMSYMYFNRNQFSGPLPSLSALTNLVSLNLSLNQFSGPLPSFANQTELVTFDANDNQFTGAFPDVSLWTKIVEINVTNNEFTGAIPAGIANCQALTSVAASNNAFTSLPQGLLNLPVLSWLDFSSNNLDTIPDFSTQVNKVNLTLKVQKNRLDFGQLEMIFNKGIKTLTYSPQNLLDELTFMTTTVNGTLTIPARNAGVNGTINWERKVDGATSFVNINTLDSDVSRKTFQRSNNQFADAGSYQYKLTNTLFPGLTIQSAPIKMRVGQDVVWTSLSGLQNALGILTKTITDGWNNAGARARNILYGGTDGWFEFVVDQNSATSNYILGYAQISDEYTQTAFDYSVEINSQNGLKLITHEGSTNTDLGVVAVGDVIRVSRVGSFVKYYKNGLELRSVAADASKYYTVKTIISKGTTPVVLTSFNVLTETGDVPDALEFATLKTFYDSLGGSGWKTKTGWPAAGTWPATATAAQMDAWYGITVANGDITGITLSVNRLSGNIPSTIGNLRKLTKIDIRQNTITGHIPQSLMTLSDLTFIELYDNLLTGSIPENIGDLKNLTRLALSKNKFVSNIPASIGNLTKLTWLSLYLNEGFTGSLPQSFYNLVNLTDLYIYETNIGGSLPEDIGNFTKLVKFYGYNNKWTGKLPSSLGNVPTLKELYLYGNEFTGTIPDNWRNLTKLTNLWIHFNQLTGTIPDWLGDLTQMQVLALGESQLTGPIPTSFSNLTNLTGLYLENSKVYGVIPDALQSLNKLAIVSLGKTNLDGPIPAWLANKPTMKEFYLTHANFTSFPDISSRTDKASLIINIQNNEIPVTDIERYFTGPGVHPFNTFTYDSQQYVAPAPVQTLPVNTTFTFQVPDGGVHGVYLYEHFVNNAWVDVTAQNESGQPNVFTITTTTKEDAGDYRYTVTNSWLPGFRVSTGTVKYELADPVANALDQWAFQYRYDARQRMIAKKVPGADWVYMVYDDRDRLVFTQDGNQRNQNQWTYSQYDALNRPIISGLYTHSEVVDQEGMSDLISTTNFFETYTGIAANHGYTNNVFSATNFPGTFEPLTITYYDNYDFKTLLNDTHFDYTSTDFEEQYKFDQAGHNSPAVIGLVTGTKVKVLEEEKFLWNVNYYDDKYRVVQNISTNARDGIDRTTNVYDFVGKVLKSLTTHDITASNQTIARIYDYDHAGRLNWIKHSVNDAAMVVLASNEYNELGQLVTKNLHSTDETSTDARQTVDYRYNIRGWLTSINNIDDTEATDLFGMNLNYNTPTPQGGEAQYNGNISEILWRGADKKANSYGYNYDPMNRLVEANYYNQSTPTKNGRFDEKIWDETNNTSGYDLNGNIKFLARQGKTGVNAIGITTYGEMDKLAYSYSGNQLLAVGETAIKTEGFKEGTSTGDDYTYDRNGNMSVDENKRIDTITYNHLNLPYQVKKITGEYLQYRYDATGRKLSQLVYDSLGSLKKTTDYAGEFFYENDTLKFINTEEGRVVMTTPQPEYQYNLKDHLGNVRVTFTTNPGQQEETATLEVDKQADEALAFLRYDKIRLINYYLFDHTNNDNGLPSGTAMRLSGGLNEKEGLAKSISVMPGDKITMEVYAKYIDPAADPNDFGNALKTILGYLAAPLTAPTGTIIDGAGYNTSTETFPSSFLGLLDKSDDAGGPKAYLNWLIFDHDFNFKDGGYVQMNDTGKEDGTDVAHQLLTDSIDIEEAGFVYIYLSNEEETPVEVYFDDFKVTQTKSPVIAMNDYYPFGLAFNSYSRESSVKQDHLYNGKELQDELNLGWLDYGARMYQPEIGRWNGIDKRAHNYMAYSPYGYVVNNPVNNVDCNGDFILPKEFLNRFQRIAQYLAKDIQGILGNKRIVDALKKHGGFTDRQLKQAFNWGQGPVLHPNEFGGDKLSVLGETNGLMNGDGEYIPGSVSIGINIDLFEALEAANGKDRDYLLFLAAVTILHEFVHYGYMENKVMTKTEEEGNDFEKDAYGKVIKMDRKDDHGNVIKKGTFKEVLDQWILLQNDGGGSNNSNSSTSKRKGKKEGDADKKRAKESGGW